MSDDLKLREEVGRAQRATDLLADPMLREAFDALREQITNDLFAAPARDKEGREQLWLMRKLLDRVEGHLQTQVQTGQMARLQLERANPLRHRLAEALPW